jgi:hypothetical protein
MLSTVDPEGRLATAAAIDDGCDSLPRPLDKTQVGIGLQKKPANDPGLGSPHLRVCQVGSRGGNVVVHVVSGVVS